MDGLSIAASIVGIATAGVQVSVKLITLATQISNASDRVSSIANDISLTSSVLHQLGELMTQKTTDDGISIFSQSGLESTKISAAMCERIFQEVEKVAKRASEQLRNCAKGRLTGGKIKLTRTEKGKWPFLQPSVDTLIMDLRDAKGTLMLMLQVTNLAFSKKMADLNASASSSMSEQKDSFRAIIALQQEQDLKLRGRNSDGIRPSQQKATNLPRPGSANRTGRFDAVQATEETTIPFNAFQTQIPPAGAKPSLSESTNFAVAMTTWQAPTLNLPTLSGEDLPRDARIPSLPGGSLTASMVPSYLRNNESNHVGPDDLSSVHNTPRSVSERDGDERSAEDTNTELSLFLLKPIVKDFFDSIEISWSLENTRMQQLAIRKYLADQEQDGFPSVIEMLHDLHAYEQAMVNSEVSKQPQGSVLSLRRTKTDIQHREMVFKAVPGLTFAVQHLIRPIPIPKLAPEYPGVPHWPHQPYRDTSSYHPSRSLFQRGYIKPSREASSSRIHSGSSYEYDNHSVHRQTPSMSSGSYLTRASSSPYDKFDTTNDGTRMYHSPDNPSLPSASSFMHGYPSNVEPVVNETPRNAQCCDHGCNGRQLSPSSDLLGHQREKSRTARVFDCHRCGAEFTSNTARDGHLARDGRNRMFSSDSPAGPALRRGQRPQRPTDEVAIGRASGSRLSSSAASGTDPEDETTEDESATAAWSGCRFRRPRWKPRRRFGTRSHVACWRVPERLPRPRRRVAAGSAQDGGEDSSDDGDEGDGSDGRGGFVPGGRVREHGMLGEEKDTSDDGDEYQGSGDSVGDAAHLDAVVTELLEKYTTLFE